MKKIVASFPVLFVVLSGLALVLVQIFWIFIVPGITDAARVMAGKISECIVAVFLLWALRRRKEAGFVHWRWKDFVPALPLLIIPLLAVVSQTDKFQFTHPAQLLLFAALAAMTGFAEETVFRGLAVHSLRLKGVYQAVLISALIFGLIHYVNLLVGADPLATSVQVVSAFLFGIAVTAPLVYTGSIWPIIVIHALQDFIAFWTTGKLVNTSTPPVSEVVVVIVVMLPFALYGLWLIRRCTQIRGAQPALLSTEE